MAHHIRIVRRGKRKVLNTVQYGSLLRLTICRVVCFVLEGR